VSRVAGFEPLAFTHDIPRIVAVLFAVSVEWRAAGDTPPAHPFHRTVDLNPARSHVVPERPDVVGRIRETAARGAVRVCAPWVRA
jgi:hypothetical protein